MRYILLFSLILIAFVSVGFSIGKSQPNIIDQGHKTGLNPQPATRDTVSVIRNQFAEYAKKFIGTPYLYGSTDPNRGFDCSGFVNHVATHFGIDVPRSSVQFTNFGITVPRSEALAGDIILFTGTNPGEKKVGHMGIVIENADNKISFVHSSSGKAKGVCTSPLEGYYETRFVKIVRIVPAGNV